MRKERAVTVKDVSPVQIVQLKLDETDTLNAVWPAEVPG